MHRGLTLIKFNMKPDCVQTVTFVGKSSSLKSTLLFQSALHWADQGYRVLYISPTSFRELPPQFHGISTVSSDAFSQIRFMALPRWQDLLQHLYSIHRYGNIPRVIVVEDLDHYCFPPTETNNQHEKYEKEMHAALVCASLLDTMSVCTANASRSSLLITSIENICNSQTELIVNNFFSDLVWQIGEGETADSLRISNVTANPGLPCQLGLEFSTTSDSSLMLNKIFSVTKTHFSSHSS